MSNTTINNLPFGISNALVPTEGPKVIPIILDFTAAQSIAVDLTQQQQSGKFSFLQSLFVDNSNNGQQTIITNGTTQQRIVVPANSQGTFPFFCPNPPKFTVQTTGGVQVDVFALNIPINYDVWGSGSGGGFNFTDDGYLETSDVALDALIANGALTTADAGLDAIISDGALNVNVLSGGGGGQSAQCICHDQIANSGNAVRSVGSGAGNYWHITGISIVASADAVITGGGLIQLFVVGDDGTVYAKMYFQVPDTALGYQQTLMMLSFSEPIVSANANSIIAVGDSNAESAPVLDGGRISCNVWGYASSSQ